MPSGAIEYAYYFSVAYSVLAEVLNFAIPLAAGAMILALAVACVWRLQFRGRMVYEPIRWLLACGFIFVSIQIGIHGESLADENIRTFVNWILGLVIVQTLCLRPRFSRRFPLVLFALGIVTLPYLTFMPGEVGRAQIGLQVGGSLSHTGGLAEWFGFCTIYFAMLGLQARSSSSRVAAWIGAVGCLLIVTLTVSRGVLLATILALIVGFRRLLRHGFVPVLLVSTFVGIAYVSGVFDRAAFNYSARGTEGTGRERLWPAAVERIWVSPITGVGISNVGLSVLSPTTPSPPHNSFLWFALSSGVIPFALYCAFWIQAMKRSLVSNQELGEGPFRLPYLLYTFVCVMLGDSGFMSFWALLALGVAAGTRASSRPRYLLATTTGLRLVPVIDRRGRGRAAAARNG
jgi:hypothetical protein